ncbi:MAG: pyroglutamyl-peptidase I [Pirellulaceae bacterium]
MLRIFITAFEPYDEWQENASWLALVEFTKNLPTGVRLTTRRYPVDFHAVLERLARDLRDDYDYAIHLGQAPGSAKIRLESIGINVGGHSARGAESCRPLVEDGPVAYRADMPLAEWAQRLTQAGIPATVSYHAGTYLCNATLYLAHHIAAQQRLRTKITFVHLPLDLTQSATRGQEIAALPAAVSARALRMIVDDLVKRAQPDAAVLAGPL